MADPHSRAKREHKQMMLLCRFYANQLRRVPRPEDLIIHYYLDSIYSSLVWEPLRSFCEVEIWISGYEMLSKWNVNSWLLLLFGFIAIPCAVSSFRILGTFLRCHNDELGWTISREFTRRFQKFKLLKDYKNLTVTFWEISSNLRNIFFMRSPHAIII